MAGDALGQEAMTAIAGGSGGLVRYLVARGRRPWWEAVTGGVVAVLLALFLTPVAAPIAAHYLEVLVAPGLVDKGVLSGAIGCIIGLTAPNIVERLIELVRTGTPPAPT